MDFGNFELFQQIKQFQQIGLAQTGRPLFLLTSPGHNSNIYNLSIKKISSTSYYNDSSWYCSYHHLNLEPLGPIYPDIYMVMPLSIGLDSHFLQIFIHISRY